MDGKTTDQKNEGFSPELRKSKKTIQKKVEGDRFVKVPSNIRK